MSHARAGSIRRALEANARRNRYDYYFCSCGRGFKRGEKNEYFRHKRKCEPEEKPIDRPTQLGLFGAKP